MGPTEYRTENSNAQLQYFLEPHIAAAQPDLVELRLLMQKFAPLVCFSNRSAVSVETYLQNAWLVNEQGNTKLKAISNNLPVNANGCAGYYIGHQESDAAGLPPAAAKCYVHAKNSGNGFTDLQYWFLFQETGAAATHVRWLIDGKITGYEGVVCLNPLGVFKGCWDRITVRINDRTRRAEQVFFSGPGQKGAWMNMEDLQLRKGRVLVYASSDGHGFFPAPGLNFSEKIRLNLYSSQLEVCLQHENTDGKAFDFSAACELVAAEYLGNHRPSEPQWLNFKFNWGKTLPDYLKPSSLKSTVMATFGKDLEFLLSKDIFYELVNYLSQHFTDTIACKTSAPISRPCWIGEELD